jgi:hypothetical protein
LKIDVRCGVFDGGKPCGNSVGTIERDGFPGPQWFKGGNYESLRWEERHYACDKHGDLQIHDEDLLQLALKPRKRYSVMATRVRGMAHP